MRKSIVIPRKPKPDIPDPYGYIYVTTNLMNRKKYIGKHYYKSVNTDYLGSGRELIKALKKYDRNNFISEPIEWVKSAKALDEREYWWTQYLEVVKDVNYYNEIEGGTGYHGGKLHPFYGGENHPFKGRKMTPEHKKHIIQSLTGRKLSEEHKQNISKGLIGKMAGSNNPMYGKTFSEEQKAKWSVERSKEGNPFYGKHHTEDTKKLIRDHLPDQSRQNNPNYGHKWSEEKRANNNTARPVVQLTLDKEFIAEYPYMRAAKGFDGASIGQCCRGKKTSYKGYLWMFKEDYEKLIQNE